MLADAVAVLIVSLMLMALGFSLVREWRAIAAWASQRVNPDVLFGPAGERVLPVAGVLAVFGGMVGVAFAVVQLLS